jgi:cell division septation protein DedD
VAITALSEVFSLNNKLFRSLQPRFVAVLPWLLAGIAIVGVIVLMTPRPAVVEIGNEAWLERDPTGSDAIDAPVTEPASDATQSQSATSGSVSGDETTSSPAPVSDLATPSNVQDTGKSVDAPAATVSIKEPPSGAADRQARETIKERSPWVINLISSSSKSDAEHFMAKARSRGVAAGIYRVAVKGKDYWRVQVSGFATAADAKAEASLIRKKLGIDDVWVLKR